MLALSLAAAAAVYAAKVGTFSFYQQSDPITDDVQAAIALEDGDKIFMLLCNNRDEKRIKITYRTNSRFKIKSTFFEPRMTVRFDGGVPSRQNWNFEPSVAYIRQHDSVASFAIEMLRSSQMVVRTTRYDDVFIDATFRLEGAREAMNMLVKACGDSEFSARIDAK